MGQTKGFYDFGAFRLDVQNRILLRLDDGAEVPLTIKEAELLLYFIENAGLVIKKDDLLDTLWKDTFVEEGTLTRNISRLRAKLETANGQDEKIIETLPKRGYRFLPAVVHTDPSEIVVEEETQIRVRVEETISMSEPTLVREEAHMLPLPAAATATDTRFWLTLGLGAFAVFATGFLIYQSFFGLPESRAVSANRITAFSGAAGRENTPAFSPDGKQIAYAWDGGEGGNLDIYVRLIGAVEPLRLTDTQNTEQHPTFTPDGSHIAFVRSFPDHGEVILIPAMGGAERRVAHLFSGFASISFAPDGTLAVIDTEDSIAGKQHAVYVINIQTGDRRRLTAPGEFVGETTPRFSPDGKSLAFVRVRESKNQDLFIVPTSGGEPRQITFDSTVIHSLNWSPTGTEILFVSHREVDQPNVWRISLKGGNPQMIAAGGRNISNLAVSPDGKTIAVVENTRNTDIWLKRSSQQSSKKFAPSVYSEHNPSFSPDGSQVAFTSNRTGKFEIWLAGTDGKNLRQLTNSPLVAGSPRFSPDGRQIAYVGLSDENSDIFVSSSDGGPERRLTDHSGRDHLPTWSADGTSIYFTSDRTGELQIWKMPASGGNAVQITRHGAYHANAVPEGNFLIFTKTIDSDELWRIPSDGGSEERLAGFKEAGFAGIWSTTRTGIYFLSRDSEEYLKIKFYEFSGKKISWPSQDTRIPNNIYGNLEALESGEQFLYSLLDQDASSIFLAELGD